LWYFYFYFSCFFIWRGGLFLVWGGGWGRCFPTPNLGGVWGGVFFELVCGVGRVWVLVFGGFVVVYPVRFFQLGGVVWFFG